MSYVDKHMVESLKDHELTIIADTPPIKAFYMKRPGTGMFSVLVVFTPEGIGLTGDLTFGDGGVWSAKYHYGLGWFSGDLSEDYLCSKFLKSDHWDADRAAADYSFEPNEDDDGRLEFEKREIRQRLKDGGIDNPNDLYDEMDEQSHLGFDVSDGVPGYGYDPAAAGWLCAVQQRFRELRAKQVGSEHGQEKE